MLDFGIQSHSNHDSKDYAYQNVTHSPYFALGRDSTQIPFGGRNIAMNSMHVQPMLLLAGIQGFKHFYFGAIGAFTTKLQWTLKTLEFDSPITKRKRRVFINQFYFGVALDFLVPLSEI